MKDLVLLLGSPWNGSLAQANVVRVENKRELSNADRLCLPVSLYQFQRLLVFR